MLAELAPVRSYLEPFGLYFQGDKADVPRLWNAIRNLSSVAHGGEEPDFVRSLETVADNLNKIRDWFDQRLGRNYREMVHSLAVCPWGASSHSPLVSPLPLLTRTHSGERDAVHGRPSQRVHHPAQDRGG